ncbi:prolyl oligopeptidase family serine peptidase [Algoriphagus litoralis]|uniref:prolyl oligopeptidase family serine peptidase n=1 Tax=Algoriphagus litoralis TaxID=2202829 RepID=UPI000DB9D9DF|nr:prolyl oligopeptidase family serine peptidase [Algoriphagus litoralis]
MKNSVFKLLSIFSVAAILFFSACSSDPDPNPDFLAARDLLDESYGSDPKQTMDVYLPAGRTTSQTPLLIYIHGGGWIDGDKSEFLQVKSVLESEFPDYAFISLNYRLFDFTTGSNGILEQEQDIIAAFNYIESQLSNWTISDDFIISGASAGGHLALLHAYKNNNSDLKAAVVFFPPTDLTELYSFNNITTLGLTALLGGTPVSAAENYANASPVTHIDASDVPTIFFHGDQDAVVPISQSLLLQEKLKGVNVRHQLTIVPGQGHGFTPQTNAMLLKEAKEFIGEF